MPGPETAHGPGTHTKERERDHEDTFTMPDITPEEQQQIVPYHSEVIVPDDASMLDPKTGELLPAPDDASALDPVTGELLDRPTTSTDIDTLDREESETALLDDESGLPVPLEPGNKEMAPPPPIRVVIAGLDKNIDQFAREAALEKLEREKIRKGPLWKHIVKRVWHSLTHEYQLVKATREAKKEILENENLRHHQGESDEAWRETTVERMGSDYGEKLMREEAGESYKKLTVEHEMDPESPESMVRLGTLDLLRRYAKGEFADQASFEAEFEELNNMWRTAGVAKELIGEARIKASNMFSVAEQVKAAFETTDGLDELDREMYLETMLSNTEIVVGEAKVGSNVELKASTAERLAEKMRESQWINEERFASVASVLNNELVVAGVLSVLLAAGKKSASFVPGLGAAIVAGFRERRALINERALMDRREDNDQTVNSKHKRQEELDETRYESRSASELLEEIGSLYNEAGELDLKDRAALEEAIRIHAEINGRMELHFGRGARLINFSEMSSEHMEDMRFDLEMALAKLETDLARTFENPVAVGMLDIEEGETLDDMLQAQKDIAIGAIEGGMNEQDKLFNKLLLKQVLKRVIITGVAAALMSEGMKTIGGAIHEYITELIQNNGNPDMALAAMAEEYGLTGHPEGLGGDGSGHPEGLGGAHPGGLGETAPASTSHPEGLGGNTTTATATGHPGGLGSDTGHPAGVGSGNSAAASASHPGGLGSDQSHPGGLGSDNTAGNHPGGLGGDTTGHPAGLGGDTGHPEGLGSDGAGHPSGLGGETDHPGGLGGQTGHPEGLGGQPGHPEGLGNNGETLDTHSVNLNDHAKMNLPNGYNAESSGNHVDVTGPDGKSFGFDLNKDGTLSDEGIKALHDHGLDVRPSTDTVAGPPNVSQETVTSTEFVQDHPDMQKIKVVGWMDQDTEAFDQNEEGGNTELLSNGGVKLSVNMTSHGSYHGGQHINYKEAARTGHLVATISAGRDSQAHAFVLQFDKDGNVVLPAGSEARSLFDEHGNFTGGYIHYGVEDGTNPDGSVRIISLATVVGKNSGHFQETVTTPTFHEVQTYTVTVTQEPTSFTPPVGTPPPFEVPPIIPIPFVRRRFGEGEESDEAVAAATTTTTTTPPGPATPPPVAPPSAGGPRRPGGPSGPGSRRPRTPGSPRPAPGPSTGRRTAPTPGPTTTPPGPGNPNTGPNPNPSPTNLGGPGPQPQPAPGPTTTPPPNPGPTPNPDDNQTPPTTPPPTTPPADDDDNQQPQQPPASNPYAKTPGEQIVDQVEAESRDLPEGINLNLGSLGASEGKMVIRLVYEVMNLVPQRVGESEDEWRANLRTALADAGNLITNTLNKFPPEARPLFAAAGPELLRITIDTNAKPTRVET